MSQSYQMNNKQHFASGQQERKNDSRYSSLLNQQLDQLQKGIATTQMTPDQHNINARLQTKTLPPSSAKVY